MPIIKFKMLEDGNSLYYFNEGYD